jgi:transcriptional regulator with XRE-family HTH domain
MVSAAVVADERRQELGAFLKSRRARIQPADAGLPPGTRRRKPGLRREEVAQLADVGLTWYTWLEQGREITVSAQVLERLAHTLRLDNGERAHLFLLARQEVPLVPAPLDESVPDGLRALIDAMPDGPALILGRRWDVLAWNAASVPLFGDWQTRAREVGPCERNFVWHLFAHDEGRRLFADWRTAAQRLTAQFRADAGCLLGDPRLTYLLECLRGVSREFNDLWTRHDICGEPLARVTLLHPDHGPRDYESATLQIVTEPHRRVLTFSPAA